MKVISGYIWTYLLPSTDNEKEMTLCSRTITSTSILEGSRMTVIDVDLTVLTLEAIETATRITAEMVDARRAMGTQIWVTLIDLGLAVTAGVANSAMTLVRITLVGIHAPFSHTCN